MKLKKIVVIVLIIFYLIACSNSRGELNGVLSYPSSYIPKMTVYLKDTATAKIYKLTTVENQRDFRFTNIPFGDYVAYAYTIDKTLSDMSGIKRKASAGYTMAVPCGLRVDCKDHTLITIKVNSKNNDDTIRIFDWYGAEVPLEQ